MIGAVVHKALQVRPESIPLELQQAHSWLNWSYEEREGKMGERRGGHD